MRYPKADWRPLGDDPGHEPPMASHRGVVLHTMVGSLDGTDAYFKQQGYVGVESHFGVGYHDGEIAVYQWTDTYREADANLDGNPSLLSIETADTGDPFPKWTGSNVPAWTDGQIDALADLLVWCHTAHDIPLVAMVDSLPQRSGVGFHRLGIDSSPPYQPGWRKQDGQHWSTSVGKVCPGDRRIAQFHSDLLPEAQHRAQGKSPWPVFGDTSAAVGTVQHKLNVAGYYHWRDDKDHYGEHTRYSIKLLQLAQGWTGSGADGNIGPLTWQLLQGMPSQPGGPAHHTHMEAAQAALEAAHKVNPHAVLIEGALTSVNTWLANVEQ